ncbi:hypothetical protein K2Y11_02435 [bacterium]|nr:hypothetical protein [bacterium]
MATGDSEKRKMPWIDEETLAVDESRQFDVSAGRSVSIRMGKGSESIEVRGPNGAPEVTITFTADGPCIRLGAARLEIDTPGDVSLNCDKFSVNAMSGVSLQTPERVEVRGEEVLLQMERDVDLRGRFIRLNSPESLDGKYKLPEVPTAHPDGCGCNHHEAK